MDKLRVYRDILKDNLNYEREELMKVELSKSEVCKGVVREINKVKFNRGHLKLMESQKKLYELFPELKDYKNE